jgi:AraC family transcriptional regulator
MSTPVNPHERELGAANAIVGARTRRYAHRFAGPLSVKSVMEGRAAWETAEGRFELMPGCALVLNDGEEYEITADALQPVETFCLFFERGFVEDAYRASVTSSAPLLEKPFDTVPVTFAERLHFDLTSELVNAHSQMKSGAPLDESFATVALALVRSAVDVDARAARLPSLRGSTREELARRVRAATSYLHAHADRDVSVAEAARAACLSPFHFHRVFASFHGVTPHRYLTRLRLERARMLLLRGEPVADAANASGFASIGSFTTLFKRTYGVTPGRINARADRANAPRS